MFRLNAHVRWSGGKVALGTSRTEALEKRLQRISSRQPQTGDILNEESQRRNPKPGITSEKISDKESQTRRFQTGDLEGMHGNWSCTRINRVQDGVRNGVYSHNRGRIEIFVNFAYEADRSLSRTSH